MLIIAALNLPSTAVFEVETHEEHNQDLQKPVTQVFQSLVRPEPEEPDPQGEVPFDFEAENPDETPSIVRLNKAKPQKPAKSIVDERVPVDTFAHHERQKSFSKPNGSPRSREVDEAPSKKPSTWIPKTSAESIRSQLRNIGLYGSMSRTYNDDDDILFERQRLAKLEELAGESGSSNSISSLSSRGRRKRQNSAASCISTDENGTEFLSLKFHLDTLKTSNRGLFNALETAQKLDNSTGFKSVGLLGMDTDEISFPTRREISDKLVMERNCHPVFVPDSVREGHYDQYCKEFLWPTFHCQIPDIPTSKAYEEHSWGDYVSVNQAIADKIIEIYTPGDIVWVHDYHLMLVPQMVREHLPQAAIGFFMHVAFPSSEVFRCLAYRAELLSGVLAANSVAFHIPEYAQHFKMSLARILAVDITGPGIIETMDHDAFVTSCSLGIDSARLDRILDPGNPNSAVQQHRRVIRQRWPHQRLIAARDKVDPIRGLPQKLRAFDQFLSENPHWANKVVLVQICNSGAHVFKSSGIESIADQINSKYGDVAAGIQPVVLLKQDVKYEQYLALLCEADGFCVSCLRDGMNLTCHEYVYCNDVSRMGPLILSEFTGSASVFGETSLLINPWNQDQLAQSFKMCVEMPRWEREKRWKGLRKNVEDHPAALWAQTLTKHIRQAWDDEMSRENAKPDIERLQNIYHSVTHDEHRLFLLEVEQPSTAEARRVLEEEKGEKFVRTYGHREAMPELNTRGSYYSSRLAVLLRDLCSDHRNIVYVTSAESPDHMERIYRSLPGIGLIAEFGKYVRLRDSEDWIELDNKREQDWQSKVHPWLELLEERSLLTHVTTHDSSIIVEFSDGMDGKGDQRDLSTIGEYISLINDHHARSLGIRTKLEGDVLTLYRSNLGVIRKNAFERILSEIQDKSLGMLMLANQPFATEADDVIYDWAESVKSSGRTRELVTTVVGKHPSHAHCMVEGTNALLTLLNTMRTKESSLKVRDVLRK